MTTTLIRTSAGIEPASPVGSARWRLPAGLGAIGFLFSVAGSWIPSFWGDEAASVLSAERTLPSLIGMLKNIDAVHGVYYLFLHFWIQAFGASEFSVRLPSAIAVGFVVAGTFVLGRMLLSRNAGIVAALICTVLPRTSYLGADARSYAFATAIAVWITILFLVLLGHRFSSEAARRLAWAGYAVGLAVGIYVFLYLGLLLVVHGAFLVSSRSRREHLKTWVAAAGLAVAAALPILLLGYAQRGQIAFLAHRGYATAHSVVVSQWFGNPFLAAAGWLLLATAAVVTGAAWRRSPGNPPAILLALLWAILPTLALLGLNAATPAYNLRYVSFCVPAVALSLAAGIDAVKTRSARIILLLVLLVLAAPTHVLQRGPYTKDGGSDLAQASAILGRGARAGDAVVFDETTAPRQRPRLALHLYPDDFRGLRDVTLKTPYQARGQLWDTTHALADVTADLATTDRVWLVELRGSPDNVRGTDLSTLESDGYAVVSTQVAHRTIVYALDRRP
ncbi:MAG: glycosyltransferase family 39 protein [Ramlibacter sp.]|nr:glycosyltransferase family 39 protein [Cryobacterium sp.]